MILAIAAVSVTVFLAGVVGLGVWGDKHFQEDHRTPGCTADKT